MVLSILVSTHIKHSRKIWRGEENICWWYPSMKLSELDSLNMLSCVDLPSESFRLIYLFQGNIFSPSAPKAKLQLGSIGLYPLDRFLWKETLQKPPLGIWITTCYYTVLKFSLLGKRHQPGTLWSIIIFERTKDYKRTATNSCLQLEYHSPSTQKGIC